MEDLYCVPFCYPALGPESIRLIEIDPSDDFGSPLRCRMRDRELIRTDDCYQTLSYVWGGSGRTHSIYIKHENCGSEGYVGIFANLSQALRRIRAEYQVNDMLSAENPLWVDAICINQGNLAERSDQVKRMADVYSLADRLIIWLGEPILETDNRDLRELFTNQPLQRQETPVPLQRFSDVDFDPWQWSIRQDLQDDDPFTFSPFDNPAQHALQRLLQSPWFRRRWVIQETLKSDIETTCILYGSHIVDRTKFMEVVQANNSRELTGPLSHDRRGVHSVYRSRFNIVGAHLSLLENLIRFEGYECQSDHDLVYTFLAISEDRVIQFDPVLPDYSISVEELFLSVAKKYVSPDFLVPLLVCASTRNGGNVGNRSAGPIQKSLPSWCPDWRKEIKFESVLHEQVAHLDRFHICKPLRECYLIRSLTSDNEDVEDKNTASGCRYRIQGMYDIGLASSVDESGCLSVTAMLVLPCGAPQSVSCYPRSCDYHRLDNVNRFKVPRLLPVQAILLLSRAETFSAPGYEEPGYADVAFVLSTEDGSSVTDTSIFRIVSCFRSHGLTWRDFPLERKIVRVR